MWFTKLLTGVLVALAGLLPSSCTSSKKTAAVPVTSAEIASQNATNKNLGELSLTNRYETCVNLGAGKSCTIKPVSMGRDNVQLTMAVESKSSTGKVNDLSVVQVMAKAGKPFEVAVGDMNLSLTPKLAGP
jgi:hypothetical protein